MNEECNTIEWSGQATQTDVGTSDRFIIVRNGKPYPLTPAEQVKFFIQMLAGLPKHKTREDAVAAGLMAGQAFLADEQNEMSMQPGSLIIL